ncbi:MAG: hypothetical protein EA369_00675 [Bradymonadales bacterium]|nr:MAG: hypothetical protein EA369_00675 [Bradymonadales bacterium]
MKRHTTALVVLLGICLTGFKSPELQAASSCAPQIELLLESLKTRGAALLRVFDRHEELARNSHLEASQNWTLATGVRLLLEVEAANVTSHEWSGPQELPLNWREEGVLISFSEIDLVTDGKKRSLLAAVKRRVLDLSENFPEAEKFFSSGRVEVDVFFVSRWRTEESDRSYTSSEYDFAVSQPMSAVDSEDSNHLFLGGLYIKRHSEIFIPRQPQQVILWNSGRLMHRYVFRNSGLHRWQHDLVIGFRRPS